NDDVVGIPIAHERRSGRLRSVVCGNSANRERGRLGRRELSPREENSALEISPGDSGRLEADDRRSPALIRDDLVQLDRGQRVVAGRGQDLAWRHDAAWQVGLPGELV